MGYNEGILKDDTTPEWSFKKEYVAWRQSWKAPHNPLTWMENSCLWYSQQVTTRLGFQKFKNYLKSFSYGNQDGAGDKGKNNGLMQAWLSSSLRISPLEQLVFLEKLIANQLPVSEDAHQKACRILRLGSLPNGWDLYGRTASGYGTNENGLRSKKRSVHWFVGWIRKGNRKIVFVYFGESPHSPHFTDGRKRKETVQKKLEEILKRLPSN